VSVVSGIVIVDGLGCGVLENEDRFNSYIGDLGVGEEEDRVSYIPRVTSQLH
jgi:hypothetical protein